MPKFALKRTSMKRQFTYTEEEMRELILGNYSRMVAYIRRLLGQQSVVCDAEDIFHDALCQFMEKRADLSSDKAAAYLFRIVRNRTLNHLTRNHTGKNSVRVDEHIVAAWDTLAILDYEGTVEERVHSVDAIGIEELVGYAETFSPRMRDIFYMSRIEGLTHREIAERIGISTRAVERYLQQSVVEYRRFFGVDNGEAS